MARTVFSLEREMKTLLCVLSALFCAAASFPLRRVSAALMARRGLDGGKAGKTEAAASALILGGAGAVLAAVTGADLKLPYLFGLLFAGAIITEIDLKKRIIPNELIVFLIVWSLAFGLPRVIDFNLPYSLAGMAACFMLFLLPAALKKRVGAGDVKLAAALGFCVGIPGCLYAIALMGLLVFLCIMLTGRETFLMMIKRLVPMGPFMAAALIAVRVLI